MAPPPAGGWPKNKEVIMKYTINRFYGLDKDSLFHILIHAGFVGSILIGILMLWINHFFLPQ